MKPFQIRFLDHVAIRVRDLEVSAQWYEKVIGLKRYTFPEWGPFPLFMLSGKTGVALFPVKTDQPKSLGKEDFIKIDHFAFNVDATSFEAAQQYFQSMGLAFELQDHVFFHSLYLKDPDGHTVELTTLVGKEEDFYQ